MSTTHSCMNMRARRAVRDRNNVRHVQVSQRLKERGFDHGSEEAYQAACYAAKVGHS